MERDLQTKKYPDPKSKGLPEDYPVPDKKEMLFFIQRNQNKNTVIYEPNLLKNGEINEDNPLKIYWIQYSDGGEIKSLNYIQNKLAYGYEFVKKTKDFFEFNFVSYKNLKLTLKKVSDHFQISCLINNKLSLLENIYVYAEELGVFPNVKFVELYGSDIESGLYNFEKLVIQK